jgi:limonene-1,2-epoxide hydrolase
VAALALLALPVLTGCGEKSEPAAATPTQSGEERRPAGTQAPGAAVPGGADPADIGVIDAWVSALARGDVAAAAGHFAIPSVAQNGPVLAQIESRADARRFNRSLPCGAELIRAEPARGFTVATFRLTERPGPGSCGSGTGEAAATAFAIEHGKIVEWRRVELGEGQPEAGAVV